MAKSKHLRTTLTIFLLLCAMIGSAQQQIQSMSDFIRQIHQVYNQEQELDFRVQYRYAGEESPIVYSDSSEGLVQMDKGRSRVLIEGIETVMNGRYTIQVIDEEKLIYVSGSSGGKAFANPAVMLDSAFAHIRGLQSAIESSDQAITLHLVFPPGYAYKKISMTIDPKTFLFTRILYHLFTESFVGKEEGGTPGDHKPEGWVEVSFKDYGHGRFSASLFDEGQYFVKTENDIVAAPRFPGYRVFIATPNL